MSVDPTSKYSSQLKLLGPLFPDWDQDALAGVLLDTKGNVEEAAILITEGESQFPSDMGLRRQGMHSRGGKENQVSLVGHRQSSHTKAAAHQG